MYDRKSFHYRRSKDEWRWQTAVWFDTGEPYGKQQAVHIVRSVPWHNVYACGSRVGEEKGGGREPIEIALDCRVQITRRHLQIAAFKPHGNADTRPLTIPTREIKLIRTFGQRSSTNRKIIAFSFFLSLFVSFRGKEWRKNCVDLTINYWTGCISILREKLKKKDWKRFRDKYIERSVRSCNFPMDIRIKEIVGWIVNF